MYTRIILSFLTFLSIAACSSSGAPERQLSMSLMSAESGESAPVDDDKFRLLFEAKLTEAIDFCTPILSGMESQSANGAKDAFRLSMAGLIAGAVIAPALAAANASANAGWIAGFSGFGGAAGFAGKNYESLGLNGKGQATQRNDIVERFREQLKIALDTKNDKQDRLNALYGAKVECVIYKAFTPQLAEQQ